MNNSRRRFRPRQKNNFRRRSNGAVHSNGHFQSNSGNNNFSRNGSMSNPFNIEKAIQKVKSDEITILTSVKLINSFIDIGGFFTILLL